MKHKLEVIREKIGLSQVEFADNLKISHVTYQNYITNKNPMKTNIGVILREKYNIDLNWFFAGDGNEVLIDSNNINCSLNDKELELVNMYRELDENYKLKIYAELLSSVAQIRIKKGENTL